MIPPAKATPTIKDQKKGRESMGHLNCNFYKIAGNPNSLADKFLTPPEGDRMGFGRGAVHANALRQQKTGGALIGAAG
jgi:hypothetical protein